MRGAWHGHGRHTHRAVRRGPHASNTSVAIASTIDLVPRTLYTLCHRLWLWPTLERTSRPTRRRIKSFMGGSSTSCAHAPIRGQREEAIRVVGILLRARRSEPCRRPRKGWSHLRPAVGPRSPAGRGGTLIRSRGFSSSPLPVGGRALGAPPRQRGRPCRRAGRL